MRYSPIDLSRRPAPPSRESPNLERPAPAPAPGLPGTHAANPPGAALLPADAGMVSRLHHGHDRVHHGRADDRNLGVSPVRTVVPLDLRGGGRTGCPRFARRRGGSLPPLLMGCPSVFESTHPTKRSPRRQGRAGRSLGRNRQLTCRLDNRPRLARFIASIEKISAKASH